MQEGVQGAGAGSAVLKQPLENSGTNARGYAVRGIYTRVRARLDERTRQTDQVSKPKTWRSR